jgi:3' terminal RNA ribose 2'-O-methyltransferase Hen1
MLLTLTTTRGPASDLGYLLHKNPASVQETELAYGRATVFYPEASAERCTAAVLLTIDPIALTRRGAGQAEGFALEAYVNDRPYVASSFLSVALSKLFASALAGRSKERPELAETAIPLEARVAAVRSRGGEGLLRRLFEPLGYEVTLEGAPYDARWPQWGESPYFVLTLKAVRPLKELLTHLYVLLPVLDDDKHYWVGDDEVDKLVRRGEGWLSSHPEKDLIVHRYLKHRRSLMREALARLVADTPEDGDAGEDEKARTEEAVERTVSLAEQRLTAVLAAVRASGARSVIDLGCGEGRLLRELLRDRELVRVAGTDVSCRALEHAKDRLRYDQLPPRVKERLSLFQSSLTYRDARFSGYDAAVAMEVIEHVDPPRLASFERVIFEAARPATVVVTTPNSEYNVRFEGLPAGTFRHRDHRFEWTRAQFADWAAQTAARHGYSARLEPIGPADPEVGSPTQMAVFTR